MKRVVFISLLLVVSLLSSAQDMVQVKYKSMFTLNFIRYIGWSAEAKQGDFVIGVLKNGPVAKMLKAQAQGKKFGYQNIVVKEFKNVDELTKCQVLFVGSFINYNKHAETIRQKTGGQSLIITEFNNATQKGSVINFVVVNNQLKFEVSSENARKQGLTLSTSLLSMRNAIKV